VDWFVDADPVQPRSFAWMVRRCCGPVGMRTPVARYQGTQDPTEGEHRRYHDPQEGFDHSPSHYRPRPSDIRIAKTKPHGNTQTGTKLPRIG
jgi:hypothetical protein